MTVSIRPTEGSDQDWIASVLRDRWGGEPMVIRGELTYPASHRGFVAMDGNERVGLVTYAIARSGCEITSLLSIREGEGIGTALIEAVVEVARGEGCARLQLVTTNDNEHAIGWYERRGFSVTDVREGAMDEVRRLKPSIPLVNDAGVPIRDEISMAREL